MIINRELKKPAISAYNAALRSGELVRPDNCQDCGKACVPDGHHDDYAKPLEVAWVCRKCHVERHDGNFDPRTARSAPKAQRDAKTAMARAYRKWRASGFLGPRPGSEEWIKQQRTK